LTRRTIRTGSQLSPKKQCEHSSIIVTFFLTKNFNYTVIKTPFCFCFAMRQYIASMLTPQSILWDESKKARFWKR